MVEGPNVAFSWKLKALTHIWTGDAKRNEGRLITTGLLGSIRWWFEVLVRGLGGTACDPTKDSNRCPDSGKKPSEPGHHCVVCELFGCTDWARKFRFDVLDDQGQIKQNQIRTDDQFQLRFTPLRPICPEEWTLLDLTIRLIADYGAIGGKTVYKPSDEPSRQRERHHRDYGLVQIPEPTSEDRIHSGTLHRYVRNNSRWRVVDHGNFAWASLENFWCVKGRYIERQNPKKSTFNKVLGRKQDKSVKRKKGMRVTRWSDLLEQRDDEISKWLAGRQQESKKLFSFKNPERTFGFVKPGIVSFAEMRSRLKSVWPSFKDEEFIEGSVVLQQLLGAGLGGTS